VRINRQHHRLDIHAERNKPLIEDDFSKDFQSNRKYGKISLNIPLLKLSGNEYYEYDRIQKNYENGVFTIVIPIIKDEFSI
jgi:HSP20 family molecular chaperone IbpA